MTDKVTKKRRGFIFVTYESEDSVDKCTEQTFHNVEDTQVSSLPQLLMLLERTLHACDAEHSDCKILSSANAY